MMEFLCSFKMIANRGDKIVFIPSSILNFKCSLLTCSWQYLQKEIKKTTHKQALNHNKALLQTFLLAV